MADSENDHLTPQDMRSWLREELAALTKETQLRTSDAVDFVTAYSDGKLTPEQANERLSNYAARWGDPLRGVYVEPGMTDQEVVAAVDKRRAGEDVDPAYRKLLDQQRGPRGGTRDR
jgi:hypothetical protein